MPPPESAQFARDVWVSYWKLGQCGSGDVQTAWRRKCLTHLRAMKSKGQVPAPDLELLQTLEREFGAGDGPPPLPG